MQSINTNHSMRTALTTTIGAFLLLASPVLAQCPTDDALEDNDTCASAVVVTPGAYNDLVILGTLDPGGLDQDFYLVQAIPDGTTLSVDLTFTHAIGDIELRLYDDATCTGSVASSTSSSDDESLSFKNTSGAAVDYYIEIDVWGDWTCNDYDMTISTFVDPCVTAVDDGLEDNDDCATSTVASSGFNQTGLFVSKTDNDYFTFDMADGETVTIDMLFVHATSDLDLELCDEDNVTAGTCGSGGFSDYLENSASTSDDEQVIWTNSTGASQTYYLRVKAWDNAGNDDCNTYDLTIDIVGPVVATPFCFGDGSTTACPCSNESTVGAGEGCSNSGGSGAILTATGTNVVANDDIVFHISQASLSTTSLLVQGTVTQSIPFKDGVFCMGNPTERVEVVFLDGSGAGSTASSIVTEGNVTPGDTRYYQQWYRDPGGVSPCGTGSNFTQGLQVDWI